MSVDVVQASAQEGARVEGGEARAPMAIATAGGMTTSTLLTLFVVPCVYAYMDQATSWMRRGRDKASRTAEEEEEADS